jgi:hypothetical protein
MMMTDAVTMEPGTAVSPPFTLVHDIPFPCPVWRCLGGRILITWDVVALGYLVDHLSDDRLGTFHVAGVESLTEHQAHDLIYLVHATAEGL